MYYEINIGKKGIQMKNLFLLIAVFLYSFSFGKANNLINDSTVTFISYWDKGESYDFLLEQSKQKFSGDPLIENTNSSTTFTMTVVDSTENDYVIEFLYGNTSTDEELNPIEKVLNNLKNGLKYKYRIGSMGEFQELINWEEIRDVAKSMIDTIAAQNEEGPQMKMFYSSIAASLNKEYLEESSDEIQFYHLPFGYEYVLNSKREQITNLSNPLIGKPIPATYSIELTDINQEEGWCELQINKTINKEEYSEYLSELIQKISSANRKENANDEIANFDMSDNMRFIMDLNSGWILYFQRIETSEIGSTKKVKTMSISMQLED